MPRVYVINDTGHDFTPATEYGEIRFIYELSPNIFALDKMFSDIRDQLLDAHGDDYLLPTGSIIANMLAFHILMNRFGVVNLLIFSQRSGKYELRTIRAREEEECRNKTQ